MRNQKYKFVFLFYILSFTFSIFCYDGQNLPQRIISLGPSLTKELYLLGEDDKLLGCTIYGPPFTKNKEKVGTVIDVNLEKIINLKPDLVLGTSLTNPKQIEKLKNLGINVVIFSEPESFCDLCSQFLELANIIGKKERAEKIVQKVKKEVNLIKNKTKNLRKTKVFIEVGAKPLFTVGENSFVNDFIEFAGGKNIAKNVEIGLYSREKVLKENPDVIIIVTMGVIGEKEKKVWKRYKSLNAVKNKRIYIISSDKICSPTPVSFVDTLKEIVRILHPEIKWIKD